MKRALDVVISTAVLVVASPLALIAAIAIRLEDRGPVLFRQERLGRDGVPFTMYKFRTMTVGAEHTGTGLFSYEDDPRVTRVGAVLRRTSLDELPQLWNVLEGTMSVVGPRPPVTYELDDEPGLPEGWERRFEALPGITGLAQVTGRNELSWPEKIPLDLSYVDELAARGVRTDLAIIVRTLIKVVSMGGVVEERREDGTVASLG